MTLYSQIISEDVEIQQGTVEFGGTILYGSTVLQAGVPGATWRSGAGVPDDSLGANGDFYLNTTNGDVYLKASSTYSVTANIKGAAGENIQLRIDSGFIQWKTVTDVSWTNLIAVSAITGSNGSSAFTYIAYADDGSGTGFTNTFNSSKNYIAIKSTTSAIATPIASDFTGLWKNVKGADGLGVPAGGTTGQVLAKNSGTDNDTEWIDAASGGGYVADQDDLLLKTSLDRNGLVVHGANLQQYVYNADGVTPATTGFSYDAANGGMKIVGGSQYYKYKFMMPIHPTRTYRFRARIKKLLGASHDHYLSIVYCDHNRTDLASGINVFSNAAIDQTSREFTVDFTPPTDARYVIVVYYANSDLGIIVESMSFEDLYPLFESYTRALPTAVGSTVELFYASSSFLGIYNVMFEVFYYVGQFDTASKFYILPITQSYLNQAYGTWVTLQPVRGHGSRYASTNNIGSDFEVDVFHIDDGLGWQVRLRRTVGTSAGTAKIIIRKSGVEKLDISPSATSSGAGTPAIYMESLPDNVLPLKTPATAFSDGRARTVYADSDYIYVCVAANTWKRVAISSW